MMIDTIPTVTVNKMPPGYDMTAEVVVLVKIGRVLRFRIWLGMAIMRFAGWVMGMGFETSTVDEAVNDGDN